MRIPQNQLPKRLTAGMAPAYAVWGDQPLLVLETADLIRSHAQQAGYDERIVCTAGPGFDWSQLRAAFAELSLFSTQKIVELRLPTGKPGKEGADIIQHCLRQNNHDIVFIIIISELGWAERKTVWFKAVEELALAVECQAPSREQLPEWIGERLNRQQQRADLSTRQFIAERVEGNLLAAHQEVQRLALLLPTGDIAFESVRAALRDVARYDIDDLSEAYLTTNLPRYIRILHSLRLAGDPLPLLIWRLTDDTRHLVTATQALQTGHAPDQALKAARVFGPRATQIAQTARRITAKQARTALTCCATLDQKAKGALRGGDIWLSLEQLVMLFLVNKTNKQ